MGQKEFGIKKDSSKESCSGPIGSPELPRKAFNTERSTNIKKAILAQINSLEDGSEPGTDENDHNKGTGHSNESDGEQSFYMKTIAEFVARTKQKKRTRRREVDKEAKGEGVLDDQEKKERVVGFMKSLEGSSEEGEWEDDGDSRVFSDASSTSMEENGLSNSLFNSQVSLSYDSHVDPDYLAHSSHITSHNSHHYVNFFVPGNPSFTSVVPCSILNEVNSKESGALGHPTKDNDSVRNPMSMRMNEEPRGREPGEKSSIGEPRGECEHHPSETEDMIRALQLTKKRIRRDTRKRSKSTQDKEQ